MGNRPADEFLEQSQQDAGQHEEGLRNGDTQGHNQVRSEILMQLVVPDKEYYQNQEQHEGRPPESLLPFFIMPVRQIGLADIPVGQEEQGQKQK